MERSLDARKAISLATALTHPWSELRTCDKNVQTVTAVVYTLAESRIALDSPKMDEIRSAGIKAAKKSWLLSRAAATRDRNESNIE
jgi:hypothetical protein